MNPGGRPRTGGLFQRNGQWYARFTGKKDGESIRVVRALGTESKQVAKAKLARLLTQKLPANEAARGETFTEAARRVAKAQTTSGKRSWKIELARLEQHVLPVLGPMPVKDIKARHISELLANVKVTDRHTGKPAPPSRETLKHLLNCISVTLDDLWRKEVLPENVARRVKLPESDHQAKERAVLSDAELARYLGWQHPDERLQVAVLERQTMSCIARLFGGVRTGDLHALRWESLDTANGRFGFGYAPRSKTKNPQRLIIDEMLRPIIRRWWEANKKPMAGLVFPVLVDGAHGKAGEGEKHHVSHADAFRTDLRRAFGLDSYEPAVIKRKDGREVNGHQWIPIRKPTPREKQLFDGDANTLPVDFHSWRRAYCQALADAGVNSQLAKALAGHATEAAHEKYLRSSDTARALPEEARPRVDLAGAFFPANQVLATGRSKT